MIIEADFTNIFIERDGHPADPKDIYLSAGASSGVNTLLHIICASPNTGVLVPIPQYPLYTASLTVLDAKCVPYYLDESRVGERISRLLREHINRQLQMALMSDQLLS